MSEKFGGGGPERRAPVILKIHIKDEEVPKDRPSDYEAYVSNYPDAEKIVPVVEAVELDNFRKLTARFKESHDLDSLHSIMVVSDKLRLLFEDDHKMTPEEIEKELSGLSPEEVKAYRVRVSAEEDLKAITASLRKVEHGMSREQWKELWNKTIKGELRPVSTAVGFISGGKIRHD